jgi:hypothetical protein
LAVGESIQFQEKHYLYNCSINKFYQPPAINDQQPV